MRACQDAGLSVSIPSVTTNKPRMFRGFFMENFYVYILQSTANDSFYKGSTNNLLRRFKEHNSGMDFATRMLNKIDSYTNTVVYIGKSEVPIGPFYKHEISKRLRITSS
jgi:hypothetical protein